MYNEFGNEQESWNFVADMMITEGVDLCFRQFYVYRSVADDKQLNKLIKSFCKAADEFEDCDKTNPKFNIIQQKYNLSLIAIETYVKSKAEPKVLNRHGLS